MCDYALQDFIISLHKILGLYVIFDKYHYPKEIIEEMVEISSWRSFRQSWAS
jgi:hypothetical protein